MSLDASCAYGPTLLQARGIDLEPAEPACKGVWQRWLACEDLLSEAPPKDAAKLCPLSSEAARRTLQGPICVDVVAANAILVEPGTTSPASCPDDKLPWKTTRTDSFLSKEADASIESAIQLLSAAGAYLAVVDALTIDRHAPAKEQIDNLVERLTNLNGRH
ncbi:MAG TPA: hypothetical protein VFS52_10670 [Steroidobacteraceae bacterium]|jgi:hypothetical protein|nr:hypothetical protein [Steroidobacteraceae bacterium]